MKTIAQETVSQIKAPPPGDTELLKIKKRKDRMNIQYKLS